jgi:carbon-monoxide dehydrogenase large subunit
VGEGGAIAPPAAILNAVNAALAEFGVEFAETPLTPRRLLGGLLAARGARPPEVAHEGRSLRLAAAG